jgi:hypothetical protein
MDVYISIFKFSLINSISKEIIKFQKKSWLKKTSIGLQRI